jgi:hypothetical protein
MGFALSFTAQSETGSAMKRYFGLLVSEWVTAIMVVVVTVAVIYGFRVGGERDASVAKANDALEALKARAEDALAVGEALRCDSSLLGPDVLQTPFLPLSVIAVPVDPKDRSAGYTPALVVDVQKDQVSGDTWDTAQRWLKALKKAQGAGEKGGAEGDPTDPGEAVVETTEQSLGEPDGLLRVSWSWKTLLRFEALAVEAALCTPPAQASVDSA